MDQIAPRSAASPTLPRLIAFLRLGRPWFLSGGILLFAVGAAAAWKDGYAVRAEILLPALGSVILAQWMSHYLNDYYDRAGDTLNNARTLFSGGSGVLAKGLISPRAASLAALVLAFLAVACTVIGGVQVSLLFLIGAVGLFISWAYSAPPLVLSGSGLGEIVVGLLVAGLVPITGYTALSSALPPATLLIGALPLVLINMAMLVAFSIPDYPSDIVVGKRTLAVRLGLSRAILLHNGLLAAAFLILFGLALTGWPGMTLTWLAFPLALWQGLAITHCVKTGRGYFLLTFRAIAIFALCSFLWLLSTILR